MEWQGEAILLSTRPHGEGSAIIEVFSAAHGRHLGVVRGGGSRRLAPLLQPGNQLSLHWRARLADQIGAFTVEPIRSRTVIMSDPLALSGLTTVCAMLRVSLPERLAHPALYARTLSVLEAQCKAGEAAAAGGKDEAWLSLYLRWEMTLLEELGFGLDLSRCAVTGMRDDLVFVSPRTGRAVSRKGAGDWADRLLPLPQALLGQGPASRAEALQALAITGHFLARELHGSHATRGLPEARARLLNRLQQG